MDKPRILIIENSVHLTGSLNAVLRTSQVLKADYDFIFVLPKGSGAVSFVEGLGFKTYEVPMMELSRRVKSFLLYIPNLIRSVLEIKKIARSENISLIHVNDFYNMIMPAWKLFGGKLKYLNYINFVPNVFPLILRWTWITNHRIFSSKIVAVSHHVLKQLPADPKVICIPDALPFEEESFEAADTGARQKILLFIGNFIAGKGQDMAIRAFADLPAENAGWKLRFVGGDMGLEKNKLYKRSLQELAVTLNVSEKIEWGSFTPNVKEEYKKASIALNFSVSESYSLTVQEAMFYGCPVIATNSGGPAELIEHRYSGLLVPVNNVALMRDAMQACIDDETMRKELALNAHKSIREKYDRSKTIDLLGKAYAYIIG